VAIKLTSSRFDIMCFTGSTEKGKLVARSAAANLVPCILELGGKCPVVIDQTTNLSFAAMKTIFGKFQNAGQTCIGVDHVFVPENRLLEFKRYLL
jgi:acyl-CoA reductase-like NAD-dependent aldehyde dehydrogenase